MRGARARRRGVREERNEDLGARVARCAERELVGTVCAGVLV